MRDTVEEKYRNTIKTHGIYYHKINLLVDGKNVYVLYASRPNMVGLSLDFKIPQIREIKANSKEDLTETILKSIKKIKEEQDKNISKLGIQISENSKNQAGNLQAKNEIERIKLEKYEKCLNIFASTFNEFFNLKMYFSVL